MPSSKKLKFFEDEGDVIAYVFRELIATLEDDIHSQCDGDGKVRKGDREQVKELRNKIADIRKVERLCLNAPDVANAAQEVIARWSRGDLAGAVNNLESAVGGSDV